MPHSGRQSHYRRPLRLCAQNNAVSIERVRRFRAQGSRALHRVEERYAVAMVEEERQLTSDHDRLSAWQTVSPLPAQKRAMIVLAMDARLPRKVLCYPQVLSGLFGCVSESRLICVEPCQGNCRRYLDVLLHRPEHSDLIRIVTGWRDGIGMCRRASAAERSAKLEGLLVTGVMAAWACHMKPGLRAAMQRSGGEKAPELRM
ncbi:hypothetical protein DAEQUDRAFT_193617 [Daedalea quercina L-15889]|uniref:Uncharacterized protein n=1 Tax=Daedalea quercina L-15889 TaxID=1314783 RepID=A0A165U5X3_9APHY|nr:hypothetical protein DAEQUDRAFT_193617 [Daedalea quercina L-15889]